MMKTKDLFHILDKTPNLKVTLEFIKILNSILQNFRQMFKWLKDQGSHTNRITGLLVITSMRVKTSRQQMYMLIKRKITVTYLKELVGVIILTAQTFLETHFQEVMLETEMSMI
jgi:hypothetical protein